MTHAATDPSASLNLDDALADIGGYVVQQRWSGAAGRDVREVRIVDSVLLREADPVLLFCVVQVTFADGASVRYALPLGIRAPEDPLAERLPDYMIGRVGSGGAARLVYDAVGDAVYVQWCWRAMRDSVAVGTAGARLSGRLFAAGALLEIDEPSVRILSVEQSNTSMVLEEAFFFKHLRRIEDAPSPELEMARVLSRAGFEHAVPVLAAVTYESPGSSAPVVLLQPFLHNAAEGWALALTSLRDLYADAEEHAPESTRDVHITVDDQGGAFVAEAGRLGAVTAELHLALATPALGPGFEPQPIDAATLDSWATSMRSDLDALLTDTSPTLDPLRDVRGALQQRFDALRELPPEGLRIRVHGDLHLGQMLRVGAGWMVLDFEGEPNRTPLERRELSSPLRDVAGMLRSFDYAAAVALAERARPDSDEWEQMMVYGDTWAVANRDAFWSAYLERMNGSSLLPSSRSLMVVRRAFEVHKAVYEVGYELSHRPSWVSIPMRFLLRGVT